MIASKGYIQSPGFGYAKYPNKVRCQWKIREIDGKDITVMLHYFDTEKKYDLMIVKDRVGNSIYSFSGSYHEKTDVPWPLKKSEVLIEFSSDFTYNKRGFNISFSKGIY